MSVKIEVGAAIAANDLLVVAKAAPTALIVQYTALSANQVATMFQNPEIALDDLPHMENLNWQAMHSCYARRIQVERALIMLVLLAASSLPHIFLQHVIVPTVPLWLLVILFAIPFLGWPLLSVPRRGFVVRDKDIIFKSGIVWRSVTAIPFNRVQHVETSNTPLDRKFGLANLRIFTAGGSGGDLTISGLGADTAEQLRIFILDKVGASIESH